MTHPLIQPAAIRDRAEALADSDGFCDGHCSHGQASIGRPLADALTESWLKDRQRAVAETKNVLP